MRMTVGGDLAGGLGAVVDGGLEELKIVQAIRADGVAGERGIPRAFAGVDRTPVLNDHVHAALQIANETGVRTVRGILYGDAHVPARQAVEEIIIHVHVRILIIREIIIDVRLAIDPLRACDPAGKALGDRPVMHPVFHVATLPRVIAALAGLESAWRVELIWITRRHQWHIKPLQRGFLRLESRLLSAAAIPAEHPVILRPHRQQHRRIAQIRRAKIRDGIPVLPNRRLADGQRSRRFLLIELLQLRAKLA